MAKKVKTTKTTKSLPEAVRFVIEKYESQTAAAEKFGVGRAYISRLLSGDKANPSEEALKAMGIEREVSIKYTATA